MNLEDLLSQEISLEASQHLLSTTTDRLTSSTGYLSTEDRVIFCTPNPARWTEISKILSDWKSFITVKPYSSPTISNFIPNIDTIEVDIVALANAEYAILKEPLFLEMSLLTVQAPDGQNLTFEAGLFTKTQESELADKCVGAPCTNRVVLAHHDGSSVRLFEGELNGVLCNPRGQLASGLGWDRIFQPQGYKRTISEMSSYSFSVNVRNKPYLELGFFLRSHVYEGLFEVHITVLPEGKVTESDFIALCDQVNCKPLIIGLPYGDVPRQMMTSSYHRGELLAVQTEAYRLCQFFAQAGFRITRAKVEAMASSLGVPETDEEALALSPENYFEFHIKLGLPLDHDPAPLAEVCGRHSAHLSRNALKVVKDREERFVTLRYYHIGRRTAFARLEACVQDLAANYDVRSKQREYSVYDSNVALDKGWITAP